MIRRRGIIGAMLAMPAIVRPGVLMPVKAWVPEPRRFLLPPLKIAGGTVSFDGLNEEQLSLALTVVRNYQIHFGKMLEVTYGDQAWQPARSGRASGPA